MKCTAYFLLLSLFFRPGLAAEPITVRLWEGDAPGALGAEEKDIPTAIVYLPTKDSFKGQQLDSQSDLPTAAIVIYPRGGYGHLAMGHEGHQIAAWANELGYAGIIVSYRHRGRGYGHPYPMLDAQRAIRLTRSKAEEWNIDPAKVGVLGFSARGHLTTTVLTHFDNGQSAGTDPVDRPSCRPDFGVVCHAIIALGKSSPIGQSKNLLGSDLDPELVTFLSNEKQVNVSTPPCFVWHTAADKVVAAENSLRFFSSLVTHGVPSELHIFPEGRHGIGLGQDIPGADQWPTLCKNWFERIGL